MIIAVDFDGTIIEAGCFPNLGPALPHAFEVLKKLQEKGHQLILWTCRGGKYLDAAVEFCKENGWYACNKLGRNCIRLRH